MERDDQTLAAPPDNLSLVDRATYTLAQQKLAQNLHWLTEDTDPPEWRDKLRRENRAIRERFPNIERDLGGPVAAAPDLSAKEAASILGLTRPDGAPQDSFYNVARKELGAYKIAGQLRIPRENLNALRGIDG